MIQSIHDEGFKFYIRRNFYRNFMHWLNANSYGTQSCIRGLFLIHDMISTHMYPRLDTVGS